MKRRPMRSLRNSSFRQPFKIVLPPRKKPVRVLPAWPIIRPRMSIILIRQRLGWWHKPCAQVALDFWTRAQRIRRPEINRKFRTEDQKLSLLLGIPVIQR